MADQDEKLPKPTPTEPAALNVSASGDVNIAGDVVGRDKIVNNIQNIIQRALSAVELAMQARNSERRLLGEGLRALAQRLKQAVASESKTEGNPFKGLLPYQLNDVGFFHGRDEAIQQLLDLGQRHPLTILQSESGAGKSSLLMAGLAPSLIARNHFPVYVRAYNASPSLAVRRAFLPDLAQTPQLAAAPLCETIWRLCEMLGPQAEIWFLLDQFEEFFVLLSAEQQREFVQDLGECLDDPRLSGQVRWVLSLRTEYFGRLDMFRPRVENPFANTLTLQRLTKQEAIAVVRKAVAPSGLVFEDGLLETIVDELGQAGGEVAPPQLQLVCNALYTALDGQKIFTQASYNAKGGVPGMLREHLRDVLKQLGPNRQLGRKVLEALTSAENARLRRTRTELAAETTLKDSAELLDDVLARLVTARVVTVAELEDAAEPVYELAHDYLLASLTVEPEVQARKAAQELLDKQTKTYTSYGTLLTPELLNVIVPFQAELRVDDKARELIINSHTEIEREAKEAEAARQRELATERQYSTRVRLRSRIIAVVGVLALVAAVVAIFFALQAQEQARESLARSLAAQAGRVFDTFPDQLPRAALLAIESLRKTQNADAGETLGRTLDLMSSEIARMTHFRTVNTFSLSPDGQWVVLGSNDGTVGVWEVTTGKELFKVTHDDSVRAVAFSPDGKWVASGSDDYTVRVWAVVSGQEVVRVTHEGLVNAVSFSPDGRWIVSGSSDGLVRVWEVATGLEIARVKHSDSVITLVVSPDGKKVVSESDDGKARVWETATGKELLQVTHDFASNAIDFSPNGQWVVSGGGGGIARVWDITTGQEVARVSHKTQVNTVAFSPLGRYVVSGSDNGDVWVWEAQSGRVIASMTHDWFVTAVDFSPDGQFVVSASADRTVRVWRTSSGQEVTRITPGISVTSVAFSLDGRMIAFGAGNTLQIWSIFSEQEATRVTFDTSAIEVAFSSDYQRVMSTNGNGTAQIWAIASGEKMEQLTNADHLTALAFSPEGERVVSGSADGTAKVWNTVTKQRLASLMHSDKVTAVDFSPNGQWVVSGSRDLTARVWNATTGVELARLPHFTPVEVVAFSPDGKRIVSGSGSIIRVWDIATATEVRRMEHDISVRAVAFSPDGQRIISGGYDATARVWSVSNGQEIARIAHDRSITTVAFSANGYWVVSGSGSDVTGIDNTVRVWEATTGKEVARIQLEEPVIRVALSSDDKKLIIASGNTVRVLWWQAEDLINLACSRLTRNLTQEEWTQYLGDEPYRKTCPNLP